MTGIGVRFVAVEAETLERLRRFVHEQRAREAEAERAEEAVLELDLDDSIGSIG